MWNDFSEQTSDHKVVHVLYNVYFTPEMKEVIRRAGGYNNLNPTTITNLILIQEASKRG